MQGIQVTKWFWRPKYKQVNWPVKIIICSRVRLEPFNDKVNTNFSLVVPTLCKADLSWTINTILILTYLNIWTKKKTNIMKRHWELCFTTVYIRKNTWSLVESQVFVCVFVFIIWEHAHTGNTHKYTTFQIPYYQL